MSPSHPRRRSSASRAASVCGSSAVRSGTVSRAGSDTVSSCSRTMSSTVQRSLRLEDAPRSGARGTACGSRGRSGGGRRRRGSGCSRWRGTPARDPSTTGAPRRGSSRPTRGRRSSRGRARCRRRRGARGNRPVQAYPIVPSTSAYTTFWPGHSRPSAASRNASKLVACAASQRQRRVDPGLPARPPQRVRRARRELDVLGSRGPRSGTCRGSDRGGSRVPRSTWGSSSPRTTISSRWIVQRLPRALELGGRAILVQALDVEVLHVAAHVRDAPRVVRRSCPAGSRGRTSAPRRGPRSRAPTGAARSTRRAGARAGAGRSRAGRRRWRCGSARPPSRSSPAPCGGGARRRSRRAARRRRPLAGRPAAAASGCGPRRRPPARGSTRGAAPGPSSPRGPMRGRRRPRPSSPRRREARAAGPGACTRPAAPASARSTPRRPRGTVACIARSVSSHPAATVRAGAVEPDRAGEPVLGERALGEHLAAGARSRRAAAGRAGRAVPRR